MLKHNLAINILFICYTLTHGQFSEVSQVSGIMHNQISQGMMGGGAVYFDYDNDGFLDLYLTGGEASDKLYRNLGNGKFQDVSIKAGIIDYTGVANTFGVVSGDIDNDGCEDLFLSTFGDSPNLLLRNKCDGNFEDISQGAGFVESVSSTGAIFIDYNGDGYLDIYVINYIKSSEFIRDESGNITDIEIECIPNHFYRNNGDGTFTEAAQALGIDDEGCGLAIVATDFDGDGDQDIYIANDHGERVVPNVLYKNNYPDTFSEVAGNHKLDAALFGMGIAVGDYDGNGGVDYYITNIGSNVFLRETGRTTYEDVAEELEVENAMKPDGGKIVGWGTFFFDYDNDTDLDLYVANGYLRTGFFIETTPEDPDVLFENTGNGELSEVSNKMNLSSTASNRGTIYGDYDHDGDLDILAVEVSQEEMFGTQLYRNDLENTNWISFDLEATSSNRNAFGAKAVVYLKGKRLEREMSSGGSHASQHSQILHFGLGSNISVDSVKVIWPNGEIQVFESLLIGQQYYIKEGRDAEISGCTDPDNPLYNESATHNTRCLQTTVFGCMDSFAINFDPAATEDDGSCTYADGLVTAVGEFSSREINVYPNPFRNSFYLYSHRGKVYKHSIELIDVYGRKHLLVKDWEGDFTKIQATGMPAGTYFLRIFNEGDNNDVEVKRLIKF